jgi:hypothetical protein
MVNIFLSWSGLAGKQIATLLRSLLPAILPASSPFMSDIDINKGKPWKESLDNKLLETSYGMFILTPNTGESLWMAYEAGAISKGDDITIYSLLFDLPESSIPKYLSDYQASTFKEEDWKSLLREVANAVNKESNNNTPGADNFDMLFRLFWREFEEKVKSILESEYSSGKNNPTNDTTQENDGLILSNPQELMKAVQSIQELSNFVVKIPSIEKKVDDLLSVIDGFQSRLAQPLRDSKLLTTDSIHAAGNENRTRAPAPLLSRLESIINHVEREGFLNKGDIEELKTAFGDLARVIQH